MQGNQLEAMEMLALEEGGNSGRGESGCIFSYVFFQDRDKRSAEALNVGGEWEKGRAGGEGEAGEEEEEERKTLDLWRHHLAGVVEKPLTKMVSLSVGTGWREQSSVLDM